MSLRLKTLFIGVGLYGTRQKLQYFFQVRLAALKVVQELNHKLGEEYLTLLPEIIPFLAELMEGNFFLPLGSK